MIGSTLGHYRIVEKIGAGGMGEVYRAEDLILGRKVAIKVLRADILSEEISRVRFLREARLIGGLNHPNIAVLYEAGESGGHPFIAMEFIEGTTLRSEISAGPLAEARVIQYAAELASALAHAHGRGVLHRDIKSANAIVTPENKLKLLDFGLAKVIAAGDETRSVATEAGTWLGTVQYSAPEVLSGRPADVRSDLYSAGVVMYEMACGQLPFIGFDTASLIHAILRGAAPPVQKRNPALSKALVQVIARAMAVRAEDRFRSAEEMVESLRGLSSGTGGSAVVARSPDDSQAVLAVLEFENLSRDAAVEWLGTGIAETIHADLKKLKSVRVIGRDRLQQALRSGASPTEVGEQLGARWLVRGGFQRIGERLRITSTLVDVATGDAIATGKVDGHWEDVFGLQDRVVAELMNALEMNLDSSEMQRIAAPETLLLEAYECYAQGRKKFYEFGKESLEEAKRSFEKAIELDPKYAMAHSGLGATYAMRFIHRTDPDDLVRSIAHSERALELDPELAEPYPFLCYAYMRQGKTEQAIQAGQKGVARQPDFAQAHYFLGAALIIRGESDPDSFRLAARTFLNAVRTDPNWTPTWMCLAEIAILAGAYEHAERFAQRAIALTGPGGSPALFPGARLFLGRVALRRGDFPAAREIYRRGVEEVAATNHMYRDSFLALAACGVGDADLRCGDIEAALIHYRRAWNITKEFPRMLGKNRVAARALAGMAAAYSAQDAGHAAELAGEAATLMEQIALQPQTWIWHGSVAELWYALAVARCRLGQIESACDALEHAAATGWGDAAWLAADPELAGLQAEARVQTLLTQLRNRPAINFD